MAEQETLTKPNTSEVASQEGSSLADKQVQKITDIVRADLKGIKGFITQELVKITIKNNGKIDIRNDDFKEATKSFLFADPDSPANKNKAVLSVVNTVKGVKDKIAKEIKKGANEESFEGLQEEIVRFQQEIQDELASQSKVENLIEERFKHQMIADSSTIFTGLTETRTLIADIGAPITDLLKKAKFVDKIETAIIIPDYLKTAMLKSNNKDFKEAINKQVTPKIIEYFTTNEETSVDGKVIKCEILNEKKLTPENIEKFTNETNTALETNATLKAYAIVINSIANLKKNGFEVNEEREQKIIAQLVPTLAGLDPDFLQEKSADMITKITDSLKSNSTLLSKITKDFTIPTVSLQKIATDITDDFGERNAHLVATKKYKEEVTARSMPEKDIYKKDVDLESRGIILDHIENLKKGSKVDKASREKITTQLLGELGKLDPDFLREKKIDIITKITADDKLKNSVFFKIAAPFRSFLSEIEKFSNSNNPIVSTINKFVFKELSNVLPATVTYKANEFKEMNNDFIDKKIKFNANKNPIKDSELTVLVQEFIKENKLNGKDTLDINNILGKKYPNLIPIENGEIKFEKAHIKDFTDKNWREIREINPAGFDKIMLKNKESEKSQDVSKKVSKSIESKMSPADNKTLNSVHDSVNGSINADQKHGKKEASITHDATPFQGKPRTMRNNGEEAAR